MARSTSIGGIFAELTLRDTKFAAGMKGAGAKLKAFGHAAARYGAMAGAAISAGLLAGTKQTLALGGHLSDLSAQTGIAVDQLIRIQQAYKDNGKDADSAAKDINKMQRAIYEASQDPGGSMDFFKELGLSAKELMGMDAATQFFTIANAINKVENQTKQAALSMDIFGRSGGQLLTVFKGSDLESVNRTLGEMPEIMRQFAGQMDLADDLLSRMPGKATQFFTGFTAGIVEHIIPALQRIDDQDFTKAGINIGNSIGEGIADSIMAWSILINTVFDGIVSGVDFDQAWSKYENAAQQIRQEQAEKMAEGIAKQEEKKAEEEKNKSVDSESTKTKGMSLAEADRILKYYEDLYNRPGSPIKNAVRENAEPINSSVNMPQFDDYQRRGLSLSNTPQNQTEKKMLTTMEQVRDILKTASQNGQPLVWQRA